MNQKYSKEQADTLFHRFLDGDGDALIELLEQERTMLFDYLLRMIGERAAVAQVLDEVSGALVDQLRSDVIDPKAFNLNTLAHFRILLYQTARSFGLHLWKPNTNDLVNTSYDKLPPHELDNLPTQINQMQNIEKALACLPHWEKEPLILNKRCLFSPEQIAVILASPVKAIHESIEDGLNKLANQCSLDRDIIELTLEAIPPFVSDQALTVDATDLSEIMGAINQSQSKRPSWVPFVALAVMIIIIAGSLWYLFIKKNQ